MSKEIQLPFGVCFGVLTFCGPRARVKSRWGIGGGVVISEDQEPKQDPKGSCLIRLICTGLYPRPPEENQVLMPRQQKESKMWLRAKSMASPSRHKTTCPDNSHKPWGSVCQAPPLPTPWHPRWWQIPFQPLPGSSLTPEWARV